MKYSGTNTESGPEVPATYRGKIPEFSENPNFSRTNFETFPDFYSLSREKVSKTRLFVVLVLTFIKLPTIIFHSLADLL